MEYKIVTVCESPLQKALEKLEKEVNKLCKEGWKPQGGVSVTVHIAFTVCQAMVK